MAIFFAYNESTKWNLQNVIIDISLKSSIFLQKKVKYLEKIASFKVYVERKAETTTF